MQAVLCQQFGKPNTLVIKEVDSLKAADHEVIISVKACGVNFPDTLIIQNLYQFKPELPFSPGGEVSGLIKSMGKDVKNFKVGDKVFALCGWGGFAEEVKVESNKVIPMIPGMDYATAASMSYNYGTSYHALKNRAKIQKGETLLILGAAGGVGLAAVELGKIMGAKVIAAASSSEKLSVCQEKGADVIINYETEDLKVRIKEITEGKGVDVVYDPVGDKWAEPAIRSMAWKGRYLVVGFAGGEIPKIPLNLPLLKGCSIVGVFWGRFANSEPSESILNLKEIGKLYQEGKIKPHIYKCYPLKESPKALEDLIERKIMGKAVVLTISENEAKAKAKAKTNIIPRIKSSKNKKRRRQNFTSIEDVIQFKGKELGTSKWIKISQKMINQFAKTTLDNQWIHTNLKKAKKSQFGGTIAHGYLTLSLIPKMASEVYTLSFAQVGINYGTEKVRFVHPVPSGSKVRLNARLKHVVNVANGGLKMIVEATIEIKGIEKPACYAEIITVVY